MIVNCIFNTPLWVCSHAIRKCYDSGDLSDTQFFIENGSCGGTGIPVDSTYLEHDIDLIGPKDKSLIHRIGNVNKHSSTLEHLVYTLEIKGVSRALLQELARHRIASLSVKSTRFTLQELVATEDDFDPMFFLVSTDSEVVNALNAIHLIDLKHVLADGIPRDIAKYTLPEAYKTDFVWTINARSLQNFLKLRSSNQALWEIRDLSKAVFEAIPQDHKYLFEESMYHG